MVLIELKHENQTLVFQRRTTLTTSHTILQRTAITPRKRETRLDKKSVACSLDNLKIMTVLNDELEENRKQPKTIQRHEKKVE